MPISEDLVELLRCPASGQKLKQATSENGDDILQTEDGQISYPIRNGIPHLVTTETITGGNIETQQG